MQNVIRRYCAYYDVPRGREGPDLPPASEQLSVSQLVRQIEGMGVERFTSEVAQNRARTSTRSGILKSEASLLFARTLSTHGVETLQDALAHLADERLDTGLRRVPGQGSGLSTKYFFMLVGSTNTVKADRMLLRALTRIVGHAVSPLEARDLLSAAEGRGRGEDDYSSLLEAVEGLAGRRL